MAAAIKETFCPYPDLFGVSLRRGDVGGDSPRDPVGNSLARLVRISLELRLVLWDERDACALRTTNRTFRATLSAETRNIGETRRQNLRSYLTHLRHVWGAGEGFFFPPMDQEIFAPPPITPRAA